MFLDNSLCFTGNLGTSQTVTANGNSTNVLDVTGVGVGNPPAMIGGFPQVNTAIGDDWGIGDGVAIPRVIVSFPATGTGAGTVQVSLQEAPDNGAYSPGTWNTVYTGPTFVGTTTGVATEFSFALPSRLPGTPPPRFYRLLYTVTGTVSVSIMAVISINTKSSLTAEQYPSNFAVA